MYKMTKKMEVFDSPLFTKWSILQFTSLKKKSQKPQVVHDIGRHSVATTSVREFPENYRRQYFGDYQFEVAYGLASFFGHYTQKVCE